MAENPTLLAVWDDGIQQGLHWFLGQLSSGRDTYFHFPEELDNPNAPKLAHDLLGMTEDQVWAYLPRYPYSFRKKVA